MERELETIFDTVTGLQASILDTHQLKDICREQQSITLNRVANWLRMNSRVYTKGGEISISTQMSGLADELDYLADISISGILEEGKATYG